ncbi:MAG: M3 family oligoendopeptidase [Paeniclostridium sordellii]|uniref:M3 family oligoendopeptidase n=1 Tax=Paeniclostridium hominis TaxID=2764329 RepID=A0ABR7K417_9FIRM|nr:MULTISPECIES: M3 family oligoendopeptidase [Paeniclostridium]MBC6003849.1 M3 family oligoendopeptidase [Paeniclostridium hominis]MDU2591975.1 M3 family oligoendopeptidase [Paeniclostridium sordellii]
MKFHDFKYERPDYEKIKIEFKDLVKAMKNSHDYNELKANINKINKLRNHIESMATLVSIRYSINTQDEFYEKEKEYWDENGPHYEELNSLFYKAIVDSKFKEELTNDLGKQFMSIADYSIQSFSKDIISELQEENKLTSEYTKLLASAKIPFDGEERNLSGLGPYMTSQFRDEREKASKAYYGFFKENEEKFDELFDKLVKVRHKMAKKLGFENFVELGYIRMLRTDYNAEMVEKFRNQVSEYIVPAASRLFKRQQERLGLEELRYYDENFEFNSGNATPKGDSKFIMNNGVLMYSELSKETKEFFEFMIEHELMDLETKPGKGAGGYCTYIPDYKSPFIFSNFNSTADDIDVLTHEAGHAFQVYMSRWIEIPDINFPTYESCEIHSMSMEFITWPWMELFFKEDTDKYKFTHLGSAIKFIPYGVLVDEFQHIIYENPNMTKEERKLVWRDLENKYQPHKNYKGNDLLERGGWWFKQGHIFKNPFYYIDYTLAQICALQFWKKMREDRKSGWQDYLNICKIGGTKSFLDIVKEANLISPFEEGCVSSVIGTINEYLESIDDKNL